MRTINKSFDGKKQIPFTVRVTPDRLAEIESIQRAQNVSLNKAVSDLLDEALDNRRQNKVAVAEQI